MYRFLSNPEELFGRLIPGYEFTLSWNGSTAILGDAWSDTLEVSAVPVEIPSNLPNTYLQMVRVTNEILSMATKLGSVFHVARDGGNGRVAVYLQAQQGLYLVTFVA